MAFGKTFRVVFGSALVLSVSLVGAQAKSIKTEDAFLAAVVGKQLMSGNNTLVLSKTGKIDGIIGGSPITNSSWHWKGAKFCRSLATKTKKFPAACQAVALEGNSVIFNGKSRWEIK